VAIDENNDESWKEQAKKEKELLDEKLKAEHEKKTQLPPRPTFAQFLTGLAAQAFMALGEAENPITKKKEVSLPEAKYLIDIIELLEEKTKGNLSEQESVAFEQLLTDLRLRFVTASEKSKS